MAFITWKTSYATGIEIIDEQHKYWLSLLDELHESQKNSLGAAFLSELLEKLEEYTIFHFSTEEKLLEQSDYPDLSSHLKEHEVFKSYLKQLNKDMKSSNLLTSLKTLDFMKDWMITHILGTDIEYVGFLKDK